MQKTLRIVVLLTLLAVGIAVASWLLGTTNGRELLHNPAAFGAQAKAFVAAHPVSAPLAYLLIYLLLGLALMPVWWLQVLAGYAFGISSGTALSCLGSGLSSVLIMTASRWLGGAALREKAEAKLSKLHALMEKIGHNGLLTVMAVRLVHVIPFALSNHVFALTPIRAREVFVGSVLGGLPAIAFYVAIGHDRRLLSSPTFWTLLIATNILLLVPLALRYLHPEWAKRIGLA